MKFIGIKDEVMERQLRILHCLLLTRLVGNAPERIKTEAQAVAAKLENVTVDLSKRLRTTAGTATYKTSLITLHYGLHSGQAGHLESTYAHELGHLVCFELFKKGGHGKEWKLAMKYLESDASRCHRMDTSAYARPKKYLERWAYQCVTEGCGKVYNVTKGSHARAKKRVAQYRLYSSIQGGSAKFQPEMCTGFRCRACNQPIPLQENKVAFENPRRMRLDNQRQAA